MSTYRETDRTDEWDDWDDEWDDDDYVPVRQMGSAGGRTLRIVGVIAMILAILAAAVVVWVMRQFDPPGEAGAQVPSVTIPEGSGVAGIAEILASSDIIESATVFEWYARFRGEGADWRAGEYVSFREQSSMAEAVEVLDAGPVPPQVASITIPPGRRLADALAVIDEAFPEMTVEQLQAALTSGKVTSKYLPAGSSNWEGLLAPDTYQFEKDATPETVLQTLADQMADVLDEAGYDRAEALAGRSAYEMITIASMVEREAGTAPDEKGKIARVIDNRLENGEPLGVDATILYGLGRTTGALKKSELETDGPYNSRTRAGLPPTPIALPSEAALQAALQPTEGPWLYYVLVDNDPSTHLFTDDYSEFQRAKAKAQDEGVF
ncbi:MAG TPA: endolytic transglycosylase MltG [Microthrixaceae bacterium]|nr:endolytic transglycosylase MltG [Microthrixaceae bacterium]